jgi:hypothetical protein
VFEYFFFWQTMSAFLPCPFSLRLRFPVPPSSASLACLNDTALLCALDRIFDDATVFKLRGESFRGKKLETVSLQTGKVKAVEPVSITE